MSKKKDSVLTNGKTLNVETPRKRGRGRPRRYTEVQLFESKIEEYFKKCDADGSSYSVTGLAIYLQFSDRHQILRYDENEIFSPAIKKAIARIESQHVDRLMAGKGWGPGIIFVLKNNFGWRDIQDVRQVDEEGKGLELGSLEVAARLATIFELARKRKEDDAQKQIPEKISSNDNISSGSKVS